MHTASAPENSPIAIPTRVTLHAGHTARAIACCLELPVRAPCTVQSYKEQPGDSDKPAVLILDPLEKDRNLRPDVDLLDVYKHYAIEMTYKDEKTIKIDRWFTYGKQAACIRTACSHINNMIIGVTVGFEYKMRFVYAHFPINCTITGNKNKVEIRNFLGEKVVRVVDCYEGVTASRSTDVKDEIVLVGNDIENVSKTWCAPPPLL